MTADAQQEETSSSAPASSSSLDKVDSDPFRHHRSSTTIHPSQSSDPESLTFSPANQGDADQATTDTPSAREILGSASSRLSDAMNEHLVAVRYGAAASILLLAAYGISNTPLFFRYRTVAELPSKHFVQRKKLMCRIIKTEQHNDSNHSIILYVRHLSPLERLCITKSCFEWIVSLHPSSMLRRAPEADPSQLLKVVLAGVHRPPIDWDDGWMDRLVQDKTRVTCQCLARAALSLEASGSAISPWTGSAVMGRKKRPIPDFTQLAHSSTVSSSSYSSRHDQVAICKVSYRPTDSSEGIVRRWFHWLQSSDLAMAMVQSGRATANEDTLYSGISNEHVLVDRSDSVKDLQRDAAYSSRLSKLEYQAAQGFYGIWSDASYRESRKDIVEEAEFKTSATIFQKLWRWIRVG